MTINLSFGFIQVGLRITVNKKNMLNLGSHNYLNFSCRPELEKASLKCLNQYGVGSCGPRGFYGTTGEQNANLNVFLAFSNYYCIYRAYIHKNQATLKIQIYFSNLFCCCLSNVRYVLVIYKKNKRFWEILLLFVFFLQRNEFIIQILIVRFFFSVKLVYCHISL